MKFKITEITNAMGSTSWRVEWSVWYIFSGYDDFGSADQALRYLKSKQEKRATISQADLEHKAKLQRSRPKPPPPPPPPPRKP